MGPNTLASVSMPPKKAYTSSAITRLSQYDLRGALDEWHVQVPTGALDLELRAMLARAIHGGSPVCACCAKSSQEPKEAQSQAKPSQEPSKAAAKVEVAKHDPTKASKTTPACENPFEEADFQADSGCQQAPSSEAVSHRAEDESKAPEASSQQQGSEQPEQVERSPEAERARQASPESEDCCICYFAMRSGKVFNQDFRHGFLLIDGLWNSALSTPPLASYRKTRS